jgi:hypothetical protein
MRVKMLSVKRQRSDKAKHRLVKSRSFVSESNAAGSWSAVTSIAPNFRNLIANSFCGGKMKLLSLSGTIVDFPKLACGLVSLSCGLNSCP